MSYTNGILNHVDSQGQRQIVSRGLPGIGFKLDANNDYDMQNKKLVNVKQGTNNNDVVTKSQLDSEIAKIPSVDTTQFVKNSVCEKDRSNNHSRTQFMETQIKPSLITQPEIYS